MQVDDIIAASTAVSSTISNGGVMKHESQLEDSTVILK